MKPKVYVETTIVSYLTASPSRDLVQAAHQQITREWWARRDAYELFISQVVVREASAGDPESAARRLAALREASVLALTSDATMLAKALVSAEGLPAKAAVDAFHIGIAVVHGMDYLLTWNCAHIANATMRGRIERICRMAGFEPPALCTPEELGEE